MFRSLIHFEFIFVHGVRKCSSFILVWVVRQFSQHHLLKTLSCFGEGNGNPLQCSCLENPRDRGALWAAVYGVAQRRTWLKRFFFFFNYTILYWFCHNIKMNPPQVYMCSLSWTLLPPPSPYHPSGSSQCTRPKHPVPCIEPGLATRFIHDFKFRFQPSISGIPMNNIPVSSPRVLPEHGVFFS